MMLKNKGTGEASDAHLPKERSRHKGSYSYSQAQKVCSGGKVGILSHDESDVTEETDNPGGPGRARNEAEYGARGADVLTETEA